MNLLVSELYFEDMFLGRYVLPGLKFISQKITVLCVRTLYL